MIPMAGSVLSELIGSVIPNQRIDRIAKYVTMLHEKLSSIPIEKLQRLVEKEELIDLVEEGFVQASRAITDERREYIASIIYNGVDDTVIEFVESKSLLNILQELNDIEIIWLRYYWDTTTNNDEEFRHKHKDILTFVHRYTNGGEENLRKSALQQNYRDHLERLNLINAKQRIDNKLKTPMYDNVDRPIMASPTITTLGKLLLKQIGLIETLSAKREPPRVYFGNK